MKLTECHSVKLIILSASLLTLGCGPKEQKTWPDNSRSVTANTHEGRHTIPGQCLPIAMVDRQVLVSWSRVDQKGQYRQWQSSEPLKTVIIADIDGDGTDDRAVPKGGDTCPWQAEYEIWIVRQDCGHLVGSVIGDIKTLRVKTKDHSQKLIIVKSEHAYYPRGKVSLTPETTDAKRLYKFVRGQLTLHDEQIRKGMCHHCPAMACSAL